MEINPEIAAQQFLGALIMATLAVVIIALRFMRVVDEPVAVTLGSSVTFLVFLVALGWLVPLGGDEIWQQALKPHPL